MFYHEGLDQNECRIHVYLAKNKAAVITVLSNSEFTCLVSIVLIILQNI